MARFHRNAHLQFTHVWGLAGKTKTTTIKICNEWWDGGKWAISSSALRLKLLTRSLQNHYRSLKKITASYKLNAFGESTPTSDVAALKDEFEALKSSCNGTPIHIAAYVEEHCVGLHILKTAVGFDIIYVNRGTQGEKKYGAQVKKHCPVQVYSFNRAIGEVEVSHLIDAISPTPTSSSRQERLANVINSWPQKVLKFQTLPKAVQNVSNCTVANPNLGWHIHIACHYMKTHPGVSLSTAYKRAGPLYRQLRIHDRAWQLINFLWHKEDYPQKSFQILLGTILMKAYFKDRKHPDYTSKLLIEMERARPGVTKLLMKEARMIWPAMRKGNRIDPETFEILKSSTRGATKLAHENLLTLPHLIKARQHWDEKFRTHYHPFSAHKQLESSEPRLRHSLFASPARSPWKEDLDSDAQKVDMELRMMG